MQRRWAFVTGPPRSGTTAASYIISRHSEAQILHETCFGVNLYRAFQPPLATEQKPYMTAQFVPSPPTGKEAQLPWPLASITGPRHYGCKTFAGGAVELTRKVADLIATELGDWPLFGDKHHYYCHEAPLLRMIWPDCRIVVTTRDEDACIQSMVRTRMAESPQVARAIWNSNAEAGYQIAEPVYYVACEDIEEAPATVIEGILKFLHLDPSTYPLDDVVRELSTRRNDELRDGPGATTLNRLT